MFAKTHQLVSFHIAQNIKQLNGYTFNKNTFAWANMKPDFIPALAVKKHYIEESFPYLVDEIYKITQTPFEDLLDSKKRKKFDAKLGVICHFISDFFCIPHNKRWEFKHSMIPHVKYETRLEKIAMNKSDIEALSFATIKNVAKEGISEFLKELLNEYEQKQDYSRDLVYSVSVCTAIIEFILNSIINDKNKYNLAPLSTSI